MKAPSAGTNRFMVDLLKHLSRQPADALPRAVEEYLVANHTAIGYWPGDDEVRASLIDAPAYWKFVRGRLRMVLEALEDAKRGYPNGAQLAMGPVARVKGTVEHLMPQTWRQTWVDELTDEQEASRDLILQQLGNLTLTTQALNSTVSNGSWDTKRAHFQQVNDVLMTNEAVQFAGAIWDESTVQQRTILLTDQILDVWPVPAGHVGLVVAPMTQPATVSVDIAQLLANGWLEVGAKLRALPTALADREAAVAQDGRVFVDDVAYDTPTGAAKAINGGAEVNGWKFWGVAGTAKTLDDVRSDYLQSLGEADAQVIDEVPPEAEQLGTGTVEAVE